MTKRILAAFLAALMASASLIACSGEVADEGADTTASTTAADTTTEETTTIDPRTIDELPTDKTFGGRDFVIMGREYAATSIAWLIVDIYTEEENGERINDAVYARNLAMAERFDVNVKAKMVNRPDTEAERLVMAGDQSFDVILNSLSLQGSLAVNGVVLPLTQLEYLDFDKAWWDTTAIEGLKIGPEVYTAFGCAQLNGYKGTWVSLFNKKLAKDAGLPDLYQVVRDGKWTLDAVGEYAQDIAKDVNGDGKMEWGVDVFGCGIENGISVPLQLGTGLRMTQFNDDGTFDFLLGSTENVDVAEKIWNFYYAYPGAVVNVETAGPSSDLWNSYRAEFASDRFGFMLTHLSTPTLIAGVMMSDFGILPLPKVYEEQENYVSGIQYANVHSITIPKNAEDPNRTALLAEGYQMLSYDTVRPAYYDFTLTLRASRDNESSEMLDIIFANRNLDISLVYGNQTGIEGVLKTVFTNSAAFTYASTIASKKDSIVTALETVVDAVMKGE